MMFNEHIEQYLSILSTFDIEELEKRIVLQCKEAHFSIISLEETWEDFQNKIWELDVMKLFLNKKEYDKMSKREKEKKLNSYRIDLEGFLEMSDEKNDGSYEMPPITKMVELIKTQKDIAYFTVIWGRHSKVNWIYKMPFDVRQALYMIAILDYDCEIFSPIDWSNIVSLKF